MVKGILQGNDPYRLSYDDQEKILKLYDKKDAAGIINMI